jgi:hypothetical protein
MRSRHSCQGVRVPAVTGGGANRPQGSSMAGRWEDGAMSETAGDALQTLVELGTGLPGSFTAEVGLYFYAGVNADTKWACDVEADIYGNRFRVWGTTPEEAVTRATTEAWRRVPTSNSQGVDHVPEWVWRDAWLLAAIFYAGRGDAVTLAEAIGATRKTSTPPIFMDRGELSVAASRLIDSGLVDVTEETFIPSKHARALWAEANEGFPNLTGTGYTRRLLLTMQPSEPAPDWRSETWTVSELDYLAALRAHIDGLLST